MYLESPFHQRRGTPGEAKPNPRAAFRYTVVLEKPPHRYTEPHSLDEGLKNGFVHDSINRSCAAAARENSLTSVS